MVSGFGVCKQFGFCRWVNRVRIAWNTYPCQYVKRMQCQCYLFIGMLQALYHLLDIKIWYHISLIRIYLCTYGLTTMWLLLLKITSCSSSFSDRLCFEDFRLNEGLDNFHEHLLWNWKLKLRKESPTLLNKMGKQFCNSPTVWRMLTKDYAEIMIFLSTCVAEKQNNIHKLR